MLKAVFPAALLYMSLLFVGCQKESIISNKDYQPLGNAAHDLLSSSPYTALRVEIGYMPGYAPDNAALSNLEGFLENYLNKPGGIHVISHVIPASGKATLGLSEIVATEQKSRVEFTGGSAVAVHILIVDANYTDSADLAISYWNTSICLFGKAIFSSSGAAGQVSRTNLLSTLLEHEFGHLLGLVGQGSPEQTPHRDVASGAHCSNPDCLMYHAVETGNTADFIPGLDADCINDLKANGGR